MHAELIQYGFIACNLLLLIATATIEFIDGKRVGNQEYTPVAMGKLDTARLPWSNTALISGGNTLG